MKFIKRPTATFFLIIVSFGVFGQDIDRARLDSLFDNLARRDLAIGSVAIARKGKIVYQRSFGKDQTAATEYRIGSITKVFTAVLVYQLIDEKRLKLTDNLGKFFPDLPNAGRITIAELLGHRSGLANFTNHTDFDTWKDQPKTHEELLAMIRDQKTDFEPDAKADYNNSNYLLLGYIVEKVYGKPYKEVLNERIIQKIGLKNTYYGDHAGFTGNETPSYKFFNNTWQKDRAVFLDDFGGAGAIISTPADLCKFITVLFDGKLISRSSLDTMHHIMNDGYGKGMFPYGTDSHRGFGHNGKTEGFGSSMQYYPENGLSIAYCTNGEIYQKADILDGIFDICFGLPYKIPDFHTIDVPKDILERYTGNYHGDNPVIDATCSVRDSQFHLQTKGQDFSLNPISDRVFWNVPFGFFFEFSKDGKQLFIKDVDITYALDKK